MPPSSYTQLDTNQQIDSSYYSHLALIFMGGISNGLPGVLTWQTLNLWLYHLGYSNTVIAAMFIASLPYSFKFIISPIIELVKLPILCNYFGRKRSWAIVSQFMTMLSLLGIAFSTENGVLELTFFFCFCTSIFSTMNQISTVSHRIDFFDDKYCTLGISIGITGYRIGKLIGRAGALYLLYFLSWKMTYIVFANILIVTMLSYASSVDKIENEPRKLYDSRAVKVITKRIPIISKNSFLSYSYFSLAFPFLQFRKKFSKWHLLTLFLVCVNLGDDMVLGWSDIFLIQLGFDKITIANITKFFGLICSLSGGLLVASLSKRVNLHNLLILSISMHILAHFLFCILSQVGPIRGLLIVIVVLEYFSLGMKASLVATLVSYLARRSTLQTGTQYAFFSSIKAIPLTILTIGCGILTDYISWTTFYFISTLLGIPSLFLLKQLSAEFKLYFPTNNVREHLAVSMKAR